MIHTHQTFNNALLKIKLQIAYEIRPRGICNLDEANVSYELRLKTAKYIVSERCISMNKDAPLGCISIVGTISAEIKQPPPLFFL